MNKRNKIVMKEYDYIRDLQIPVEFEANTGSRRHHFIMLAR